MAYAILDTPAIHTEFTSSWRAAGLHQVQYEGWRRRARWRGGGGITPHLHDTWLRRYRADEMEGLASRSLSTGCHPASGAETISRWAALASLKA